jgi:hypothetical protein
MLPCIAYQLRGGTSSPVTALDISHKEISHRWVQFLPDGRHFLYTAYVDNELHSEDNALYVAALDSGRLSALGNKDRKRLFSTDYKGAYAAPAHGGLGHLLFWRGKALMAQPFDLKKLELVSEPVPIADQSGTERENTLRPFSISETSVLAYPSNFPLLDHTQMVWYDRAGRRLGTVGEPGQYVAGPRISSNQKLVAVERADNANSALWVFDLYRNTALRFTFHASTNRRPVWSPDGSRIVFSSNREGAFSLYQKAVSGESNEEQILKTGSSAFPFDWSRDGRFIVYAEEHPRTASDIWVLPREGGEKAFPFAETEFFEWMAAFSPDGRWLAYASDESGKMEVYVPDFHRQAQRRREWWKMAHLDQGWLPSQVAGGWQGVVLCRQ